MHIMAPGGRTARTYLVVQEWLYKCLCCTGGAAGFPLVRSNRIEGVHGASAYRREVMA